MPQLSRGRRLVGEINVVPYIDVMLVLLIIFMITAPMLTQGVNVELPKAGAEPLDPQMLKTKPLMVSIDREGRLYLNRGDDEDRPLEDAAVAAAAAAELQANPEVAVLVKADRSIPYGRVMEAMVILQGAGAQKVGFVTEPLAQPQRDRR